ncbi:hypothetical protein [Microtetraspora sp. NBRC 16547]|uniref:hypothetical protein n=1 Tax=Microtetraspora sp. NBRC 16547 TaxID=3030993 RepID=UPI0024A2033D|nr:hypothetical protein [Microtetraspora sp. NBRC 16547]GLW99659.1 hypothetical protein Misp02_37460 [Microtetraspora sp. NBRC 16547]
MTRLHEALEKLAEEAPPVSLADAAIAGHRRRRRTRMALTAIVTVAALVATTEGAIAVWPRGAQTATPQRADTVADLPDGKVGPVSHAYQTPCLFDRMGRIIDCGVQEWRVVTRTGTTYRVPQALVASDRSQTVCLAVSRDGRMLAYYSREAQAHIVRDLVTGAEVRSPVKVTEDQLDVGNQLVVSDDGRYLVFDPKVGSKKPGVLIDMRTGTSMTLPGKYEAITVKGGVVELVRYTKTDLWLMPVTGGGKPARFDGVFINFSELAPDGRTVAAFDMKDQSKPVLTLLDTKTGRILRKVTVRGLAKPRGILTISVWESPSEVMVLTLDGEYSLYAVNINTGKARHVADYSTETVHALTLPGTASGK